MRQTGTPRRGETGFTLVEVLVAIVILVFGLVAVTNLMIVAGSSNSVANATTATTAAARQRLDVLKATPFTLLPAVQSGTLDTDTVGFFNEVVVPGVAPIHTRWRISPVAGDNQLRYIEVASQAEAILLRSRSRVTFSTFRACTARPLGCPAP